MLSPCLLEVFFADVYADSSCVSEGEGIMANLIHLKEDVNCKTEKIDRILNEAWDILYVNDSGLQCEVSMATTVSVFEAGLGQLA